MSGSKRRFRPEGLFLNVRATILPVSFGGTKMRRSKNHPFSRIAALADERQSFAMWVGSRKCLFAADEGCDGPVRSLELDFASTPPLPTDLPLIPVCESHRGKRLSEGWGTLLRGAALSRTDLVSAASLLSGRWNSRRSSWLDGPDEMGRARQ